MPANDAASLSVRWELLKDSEGAVLLTLHGDLDAVSTPGAWSALEKELTGAGFTSLEIDAGQLNYCDSAGLALLYYLYSGGMTPGATVRMSGLSPELQNLFGSFSMEDFQALQSHKPACRAFPDEVGTAAMSILRDLREQVEFIGEVTANLAMSIFRHAACAGRKYFACSRRPA